MQDIWGDVDALLATPPPPRVAQAAAGDVRLPSVWDDVDALLATPPTKPAPARLQSPADAERRVPPIAAEGITDPASLRVTDAPLAVPPPETTMPGYFNPKTGTQVQTPAAGAGTLEAPAMRVAAGIAGLGTAALTPTGPPLPGISSQVNAKTGAVYRPAALDPATLQAGNDLAEGLMELATPRIGAAALAKPFGTAAAMFKAVLAATVGTHAAGALGASPEAQSLVGNVAAILAGTVSSREVFEKIRADARSVAAQARAFDAAHPDLAPGRPQPPVEPRPVGRGSTPAAGGRVIETPPADIWTEVDRVLAEGGPRAVPQSGAEILDVRQPSGDGDTLGGGHPEGQVPAGPRQDLVAAPEAPAGGVRVPPAVIAQTSAPAPPVPEQPAPPIAAGGNIAPPVHAETAVPAVAPAGPLAIGGVEERAPVAGVGPQPPGQRPPGGRPREPRPTAAAAGRATETDTLDSLVSHAQTHGYAGDPVALRGELETRLALIKDLDREFAQSGRNPETLLRDIARLGGLSVKAETGLKGELKWLKEFQDNVGGTTLRPRAAFGQVRGVQGVFREGGLPVDTMLTRLKQDARYAHLDSLDTLLEEIRAAAMADHEGTAVQRLREGLGEQWWDRLTPAPAVDTLDTGEQQTRLPGAEGARQVGRADTTFRAPGQATGDDFAQQFLGEHDVPIEVEQDLLNDEPGSSGLPRRPFTGAWERLPPVPGEKKPAPPVPPRKGPAEAGPKDLFEEEKASGMPVSPRPASASPGGMFGKQELPANRPTTLPARRFGRKVRVLPVAEIVQKLSDLFGRVPVSTGKLYKGYLGVYQHGPESIRVQVADDLHVIAHEMGHHLDMAIMEGSVVFNRGAIAKELKRLGAPTSMPSYTPAQQRREGTAEFFRRWLTDETDTPRSGPGVTLATEAPRFTAAFEHYLERHPKIGKGLKEIRNDVQRYLALPAEEQARLHIDFAGGGNSILRKAQELAKAATTPEGRRRVVAYLSSHWMEDLAALRLAEESVADGRPIDIIDSGYRQARLARRAPSKAEGFLEFGVRDTDGTFLGRSFDDALAPVYDRLEDFAVYAAVRRAKTMHARGKESGFTQSQIDAAIAKHRSPAFDQALDGLRAFHRAKLDYMVRGGAISDAQRVKMLQVEPDYIPYQRVLDTASSFLSGKKIANRGSPIKYLKGSGRRLVNPLETIIRNTHAEVNMVETNRAMGKFVRLALKTQGHGKWLEEIPAPQVATTFNLKKLTREIGAALEEDGVELPDGGLALDEMLDALVTVFTPQQFAKGNNRIVTWIDGGTRRWFEVHDEALFDALTAIGPRGAEQVVKWFQKGARVLQRTAVSTLGFAIRNPFKDQFSAFVQSRAGYRPGVDFLRGLFAYLGRTEDFQLYVNSLGDQATMVSENRDLLRKRLRALGHGPLRRFLDHTILGPFDGLNALSHAGESATRIGEFMRTLDKAGFAAAPPGPARERILMQGGLNAGDVTQDFTRAGRQVRAWNQYSAFFSARVGGYGKMWEAFHENPTNFMWKALTSISLISVLLWIVNHDDPEYNNLPAWERNSYWHVPLTIDGKRLGFTKWMKPFELGQLFGTATELALEYLTKSDPQVANRLLSRQDAAQLVEQVLPTAVLPITEYFANYDFFRDRTIVNPWQEDLAPPLQYNRWTSETAKKLGDIFDVSPAKIDTIIYGYTAGVGQGALEGIDLLVGSKKPAGGPGRWPGVGAVYRPLATSDAETFQEFYKARDALAGLKSSVKQYREMGREDKARALVEKNRQLAPFERSVPAADRQLKDFRDAVNQVFANSTMTPAQKHAALDALYLRMLNIAGAALGKPPLARKPPPESAFR